MNELETIFCPNFFDKETAINKGLLTEFGELDGKYYKVYRVYKKLVELLLLETSTLKRYDNILKQSELNFKTIEEDDKDVYQKNSIFEYFYLRNTLYVECLPEDIIEYLLNMDEDKIQLGFKERNILASTLMAVITNNHPEKSQFTNYGPIDGKYIAPINSLVIGFRYNPYEDKNKPGYDDDKWYKNNFKQNKMIADICFQIEQQAQAYNIPLKVMIYNKHSVIPFKKKVEEYGLK